MKYTSIIFLLLFTFTLLTAQNSKGTKERIKVHSQALEGNLIQDPARAGGDRLSTSLLPNTA
jgi:hypothetical protein